MRTPLPLRLICVAATLAAVLVPALATPARTIRVPRMLSTSTTLDRSHGRLAFQRPVSHVAFSWSGSPDGRIRFRTFGPDGAPSRWSTAVESHDLSFNDRHHSGVIAIYGTTKIEYRRVVRRGTWMGPVTIDLLDALSGPKREITVPSVAHGLASEPRVVTRAEWGADESLQDSSGGCARTFFPVQQLFVHHTAGANNDRHPRATMRSILWFHTARRGWCDIGYNFIVGPNGEVFEGRRARTYLPWETHDGEDLTNAIVRGAHTGNHNPGAVGISMMGNFVSVRPTRAARRSLVRVLAWEADRHGLNPTGRHRYVNGETGARDRLAFISGHRDVSSTSCPGGRLYRMLPGIRRSVATVIGSGKVDTRLALSGTPSVATYGDDVNVGATLTNAAGKALAGRTVTLYGRDLSGDDWVVLQQTATDDLGRISTSLEPESSWQFAAVYAGATRAWGAHSTVLRTPVRPLVSLEATGGSSQPDGVHFPYGTTGVPLHGMVTPAHPGRSVIITIERLNDVGAIVSTHKADVDLADDGASYAYLLATSPGDYRIRTTLPRHHDHGRGRSADLLVTVEAAPV